MFCISQKENAPINVATVTKKINAILVLWKRCVVNVFAIFVLLFTFLYNGTVFFSPEERILLLVDIEYDESRLQFCFSYAILNTD